MSAAWLPETCGRIRATLQSIADKVNKNEYVFAFGLPDAC